MVYINESEKFRKLGPADYRLMNLPPKFIRAKLNKINSEYRKSIQNYIDNRIDLVGRGVGLIIYGPHLVGKTSAASVLLKALRAKAYKCFFISGVELISANIEKTRFDENASIYQRCLDVDVLCIDNLTSEDLSNPYYGLRQFSHLIRYRSDWERPTFITTEVDLPKAYIAARNEKDRMHLFGKFLRHVDNRLVKVKAEGDIHRNIDQDEKAVLG